MIYKINGISETQKLANDLVKCLNGGEIFLLKGDLGAGKTTFVRFVAKELGVKDVVTSPTFTIQKTYIGNKFVIKHFDMYRIENENECEEFGFLEQINTSANEIVFIEWPEKIKNILPSNHILIDIKYISEFEREFEIVGLKGI